MMKFFPFCRLVLVLCVSMVLGGPAAPSAQTKPPSGRALGPVLAKVRIDVFSDFQCPSCKGLAEGTLKRIKEDYALKGKIRLVHHDFPLPPQQSARQAALLGGAGACPGEDE